MGKFLEILYQILILRVSRAALPVIRRASEIVLRVQIFPKLDIFFHTPSSVCYKEKKLTFYRHIMYFNLQENQFQIASRCSVQVKLKIKY